MSDDTSGQTDLLKTGVQIRVRLAVFATLQAARDKSRQNWKTERLVIPESRPTFDKEFRLLRKVFGLRENKRLF